MNGQLLVLVLALALEFVAGRPRRSNEWMLR
jgi:hypothetical protein